MTREHDAPSVVGDEIDRELISDNLAVVEGMAMATSTRKDIDARLKVTLKHLDLLMSEDLGFDNHAGVRELYRGAYKHLELNNRPTPMAPAFYAFNYLGDSAALLRRFLDAYERKVAL
ncbi:hypothetical protein Q5762_28765 [Streptomyces sp. P9(2023)]|uniref:hypothetical protein n=1 Tax=Streptomyces sp. P9(2023) TaxID=3064394 RepID=UPI0028F4385A|nr:hypothetical protein [Streptomyces sp. P9(2023)]MDT9692251.1 hypothetical protein [Streptomyces sp. P9(2023)]